MRGDGCSGMSLGTEGLRSWWPLRTLKPGDLPEERDAIWRGSMVGQNGKSATLTAPNGIAQEAWGWRKLCDEHSVRNSALKGLYRS